MNAEQQAKQWGQIVAKAWHDDGFKKRLLADPTTVLKEQGVDVPAGVQVRLVENTDQVVHLMLPAKPSEEEISDEDLAGVAGGMCGCGCGCGGAFRDMISLENAFGAHIRQVSGAGKTPAQQAGSSPGSTPSQGAGGPPRPA